MSAPNQWADVRGVPVNGVDGLPRLDLRGLEPPQPAVTILTFLNRLDCGDTVLVRLDRDPVFLFPELVELGWSWKPVDTAPGDVRLRLTRNNPESGKRS